MVFASDNESRIVCLALFILSRNVLGAVVKRDRFVQSSPKSFSDFVQLYGRSYIPGSEEYRMRSDLFEARAEMVGFHNNAPNRLWKASINHLADRTNEELAMLRGYRRSENPEGSTSSRASLLGMSTQSVDVHKLPNDWTWVGRLQAMQDIKDQGECGSCWAVATTTVLRAHSELYQRDRTFSTQQLVSCMPNPRSCGGEGGCRGATAELAMDYVSQVMMATEDELRYQARDTSCPQHMQAPKATFVEALRATLRLPPASVSPASSLGMSGWRQLPKNSLAPLMAALYEQGPVVVSVSADDNWNHYDSGVMDACPKDTIINHAVVLVGYGEAQDVQMKYWQIQNSWGGGWGEHGHVRLLRHDVHEEGEYCGWDDHPEVGTACKGGPSRVKVCGSCGVLFDSVVPMFQQSETVGLSRHIRRERVMFSQLNATAGGAGGTAS